MKLNLEQVELLPPEERIGETEPMGKSSFQHRPELIPLAAPSFCIYCFILVDYGIGYETEFNNWQFHTIRGIRKGISEGSVELRTIY